MKNNNTSSSNSFIEQIETFQLEDNIKMEASKRFKELTDQQRLSLFMSKIKGKLKTSAYNKLLDGWWMNRY